MGEIRKYLVTYAQNATPVNSLFLKSMLRFCESERAELLVIPGRYKNPTSVHTTKDKGQEWWAPELAPYLLGKMGTKLDAKGQKVPAFKPGRKKLCENLVVLGDVSVQPTATNPLSRFEVHAGASSVIVGHPKRALQAVATSNRAARAMWSTGACTKPNYTDSRAGKTGQAHHVIGAVVVEVDVKANRFWARHVSADWRTGVFTDLGTTYTPTGSQPAQRALTLTLGDYHAGREDAAVLKATQRLCDVVRPKAVVLHDVLDFHTRSHHARGRRDRYDAKDALVELEVEHAVDSLDFVASWGDHAVVVTRSNHDEHLERWLEEHDDLDDPTNAPYYHDLWSRVYSHRHRIGEFPDCFAMESRRLKVNRRVRFLRRNESFLVKGVEHGLHGDKGLNGARGSDRSLAGLGVKVTKGHSHSPAIFGPVYSVGVTGSLDMGYNHIPSTWMHAHVVLHADGKRQLVIIIDGRYGAEGGA